jgi:hypothetical protein
MAMVNVMSNTTQQGHDTKNATSVSLSIWRINPEAVYKRRRVIECVMIGKNSDREGATDAKPQKDKEITRSPQ